MDDETRRIKLSADVWRLVDEAARVMDVPPRAIFRLLFLDLFEACSKGNSTIRKQPVFDSAWNNLGLKAAEDELADVDLAGLATNNRNRGTGFDGVYEHRDAFVIDGRDPVTNKMVRLPGRYTSAAKAAHARREHYKRHNMPYGKLEEAMEKMRNDVNFRPMKPSERWIYGMAIWSLAQRGIILPDLPAKDRIFESQTPDFD